MPCFVGGLHAYDGEINPENEKNKILNEFAVKLLLDYEEKNGEKIIKKELLVSLKGDLHFVKSGVTTIYHDLDPFGDDSDNSNDSGDDWEAILQGVDFGDITQLDEIDVPPFVVNMGKKEATEEVIRSYKTIREKNDLGIFVLPIRIEAKFDTFALADTGSNINVIPYRIYAKLGREEVKPLNKKITILDHSKAEPIGILKDVLRQVGVTTILAKFLILEIHMDKDVPIVVGQIRNKHEESDDDEEEYIVKRDKNEKPIYGSKFAKYMNFDDYMDHALALQEAINPFTKIYTSGTNDFEADLSSRLKRTRQHETLEEATLPHIYSPVIVVWEVLNNMGCAKAIEDMLEIKVYKMGEDEEIFTFKAWRRAFNIREHVYAKLCHDFYATFDFDETITDEDLMSKKVIKFRLGGCVHTMTILEFTRRLGLNSSDEIQYEGFETYFHGGLRNDDHFNVNQYWSEISSENELIMSRSSARTIRKPVLKVLQNMITICVKEKLVMTRKEAGSQSESMIFCGQFITKIIGRANLFTDEVLDGLSALVYCRPLDTTTLREMIDSNRRLIAEEPTPGDPIFAVPRPPRHSISDIYDMMGRMEIRQGELERMARRQLYHTDRYAGVF
uniref:Reverse transcriptase domain-containing protein n=1 Tax=Tanacetum cinerariifolium TaxID=118510 RepID=A0A6L2P697_TANCI|nr:hypothetical protein [Tanacetum cinerariifolium]